MPQTVDSIKNYDDEYLIRVKVLQVSGLVKEGGGPYICLSV